MSIVPKETVEVIAQSIGINNLSSDVALALASDVEYRMREIMQEAIKCMRHSKRTTLTTDDVDSALGLRNVEPIYGFTTGDPLQFRRAVGHKDLFYIDDKDVDFKDVIEAPLPKAPLDTSIVCHWLAIEGVQPAIPENAPVEVIAAPPDSQKAVQKDDKLPVDIKLPIKHVLSRELQLYFEKITELTVSRSSSDLFKEALVSLATDSGLHPLIPYFTCFIADEVSRGLSDFPLLFALMRIVLSLLHNPHIHIEPYDEIGMRRYVRPLPHVIFGFKRTIISFSDPPRFAIRLAALQAFHQMQHVDLLHQLMPSIVTCLVAKRLGNRFADNHWELRDFTANLVASICKRFGHVYNNLQTRLTKTLLHAFLDPKRALTQHYGAIQGLSALGPNVVRLLILPNLETYLQFLEPEMLLEKQKNEMKRHEAWRVYGALLRASGQCVYDRLKMFPHLPSPSTNAVWKVNGRVVTTRPNKRKASEDQLEQQPPLKKTATDGPIVALSNNSLTSDMQIEPRVPAPSSDSDVGPSSSYGQYPNENNSRSRDNGGKQSLKMSAFLAQAWKDDLNSGHLLSSLFELFGESIFSFIPTAEMSLFL